MIYALIGCSVCGQNPELIGRRKGDVHSVPAMPMGWHRLHPMNGPTARRHDQLYFKQETRIFIKPLGKELKQLSLSETPPVHEFLFSLPLYLI
jgi:hypothetical protein